MNQHWQPIATAPKDGTPILACIVEYGDRTDLHSHPRTVAWDEFHPNARGKACWRNSYGHKELHLTHWMPLPDAPKRKAEQ